MNEYNETYAKVIELAESVRKQVDNECKIIADIKPEFCEHAMSILSKLLLDNKIEHRIMWGLFDCDGSKSHVWIEIAEEVLDITADQFGDFPKVWYPADSEHYNCFIDVDEYTLEDIKVATDERKANS